MSGQTVTRARLVEQGGKPPAPAAPVADTGRIQATYPKGAAYRTQVKTKVVTRGTHKDWGIETDMNMVFLAELEFFRTIEENNGRRIVLLQEFGKAEFMNTFTEVSGIRLNLGERAETGLALLEMAGLALEIPPGWSMIAVESLDSILASDMAKAAVGAVARDANAKLFVGMDGITGKKARITFEDGKGVTAIEAVGCTLTEGEQDFIFASAICSDLMLMKDEKSKVGDTWEVRGEDFLPIIDPSMSAALTGTVTVRRDKDGGTPQTPTATIRMDRGAFDLKDQNQQIAVAARWEPRGDLHFSFQDRIFTSGRLTGNLNIMQRSIDHLVFEMKHSMKPDYEVVYFCEKLK